MIPARLTGDHFTHRSVFDRETERIFRTHWLCAIRAEAIDQPGQYATANVENARLLLMRGKDGVARAMHNVCRHRGAIMVDEAQGTLTGGCVTCPYHAWAYDDHGRLMRAPNLLDDDDRSALGLNAVACQEWNGYLMLNLTGHGDLPAAFAPLQEKVQAWDMPQLRIAASLHYEVAANWKLLFHNYSECYHCPTVHPALNRLTPYRSAANDLLDGAFLGGPMRLNEGVATMSISGQAITAPLPRLSVQERRQVAYYTVFPNMFISTHPDYVMVHRLQRHDVDATAVTCEFLFHPSALATPGFDAGPAVEFWDQTNRQDWAVCERVQQGAASLGFTPGFYTSFESVLPHFDAHYLQALEHEPDVTPPTGAREGGGTSQNHHAPVTLPPGESGSPSP